MHTLALHLVQQVIQPLGPTQPAGAADGCRACRRVSMVVQPIVGVFSDRARTKLGRRLPFIIGGTCESSPTEIVWDASVIEKSPPNTVRPENE